MVVVVMVVGIGEEEEGGGERIRIYTRICTAVATYLSGVSFELVQSQARIVRSSDGARRYAGSHHYPGYGYTCSAREHGGKGEGLSSFQLIARYEC